MGIRSNSSHVEVCCLPVTRMTEFRSTDTEVMWEGGEYYSGGTDTECHKKRDTNEW